jgi:hypothetical protein
MDFCKCGSLIVNGNCTNKNCSNRTDDSVKSPRKKARSTGTKSAGSTRQRRTSKMVTYNIYETEVEEENGEDAL